MNIVDVLLAERKKYSNRLSGLYERMTPLTANATTGIAKIDPNTGEERMVSYLDVNKMTTEEQERYYALVKRSNEERAKRCLFETYIKSQTPESDIQFYDSYVEPLSDYKNTIITHEYCDIDFKNFGIQIGNEIVDCPCEMTFDEYSKLYLATLNRQIEQSLGNGLSEERINQEIQKICSEVYLAQRPNSMSL